MESPPVQAATATLLDEFAKAALMGVTANLRDWLIVMHDSSEPGRTSTAIAEWSYEMAAAMVAEREKRNA